MADWTGQRNGPDYTVDIPKAKRKLTLADLATANGGVPQRQVDSADPGVGGDPLAEAKAFLAPYEAQDRASANAELARKNVMAPEYQHSGMRGLTMALDALGKGVSGASLPGYALGPEVGGPMQVIGGALGVPEYMRRRIAPDVNAGEQPAGVGEGVGLGADIALGGLFGRGKAAVERPVAAMMEGPSRYESAVGAVDSPNFQQALSPRQNAQEALDNLLTRLNKSNPADRSVRGIGNLQQEAPGGLADVAAGKVGRTPYTAPGSNIDRTRTFGDLNERIKTGGVQFEPSNIDRTRTYGNARELMTNGGAKIEQPSLTALEDLGGFGPEIPLSPLDRASQLARKQALAKSFRTNTPLAEGF